MMKEEYSPGLFLPSEKADKDSEQIHRPSIKYWADVWRRLKQNKLAMFGFIVIGALIVMAVIGTRISGFKYYEQNLLNTNQKPGGGHWFGTDDLGRDMFTRIWYGARYSLLIGVAAAFIDFCAGVLYGGIAGMGSSKLDSRMMRVAEVIYSIPYMLIVIMMMVVFTEADSLVVMILALGLTGWVPMAILVRGQVLQLKENEYVTAANSLGASKWWILRKHIIPNAMGPILVNVTLLVPSAIFAEATLSFIGLGIEAPKSSWGTMASDGLAGLAVGNAYQLLIPAVFISLTMFAFNVLGDGLRDALDPRLRK